MILTHVVLINVHTDPSHSFFEVPADLVNDLSLNPSKSSYLSPDRKHYFLECTKDAELFLHALDERNIDFRFEEIEHEKPAFFRQYDSAAVLH